MHRGIDPRHGGDRRDGLVGLARGCGSLILDLESPDAPDSFDADLCIIGAGPAGLTVAQELAGLPCSVLLLESGGIDHEPETQALCAGEITGIGYSLDATRLRRFGGTTNHWEGRSLPLSPIDFESRNWVPLSGWPFPSTELDRYYERAHPMLALGPLDRSTPTVAAPGQSYTDSGTPAFSVFRIVHPVLPTFVSRPWREAVEKQANVRVVLHANAMPLESSGRTVTGMRIATLGGKHAQVRAKVFVLATGGIENPRLLLASGELGNSSGMVGRCFMEHVFSDIVAAVFPWMGTRPPFIRAESEDLIVEHALQFTPEAARELGVLSCSMGLSERLLDSDPSVSIPGRFYTMWVASEQAPDRTSRVMLSNIRDRFGVPCVNLHWSVDALTQRTVKEAALRFAGLLQRSGFGATYVPPDRRPLDWPHRLWPACHHMGTTRMSTDPTLGVVDGDCKAHDLDNLYIAGSSVFPTVGHANPTLTLTALALRLGEHLKARLGR